MAQNDFFQRKPRAEFQCPSAQAADGPGRHFDHPRTVVVYAQFSVHGALGEADGLCCGGCGGDYRRVGGVIQAGRRDIDGFFEGRALQGVGLIEQRQGVQFAVDQQCLQRHLDAGHIGLHQDLVVVGTGAIPGIGDDLFDPEEGLDERVGAVGAQYTPAAGKRQWFQDARVCN